MYGSTTVCETTPFRKCVNDRRVIDSYHSLHGNVDGHLDPLLWRLGLWGFGSTPPKPTTGGKTHYCHMKSSDGIHIYSHAGSISCWNVGEGGAWVHCESMTVLQSPTSTKSHFQMVNGTLLGNIYSIWMSL